jgi:hypothetical protein
MEILFDMRRALASFETEAADEIHRFLDFIHVRHNVDVPAIVPPPAPLGTPVPEPTYIAPIMASEVAEVAVEEAPAAEVAAEEAPAAEEA